MLYVSHDRELLARTATQVASVEPTPAGSTIWVHGGGFATYAQAREDRRARSDELLRRWEEEHAKLEGDRREKTEDRSVRRHAGPKP